MNAGLLAVGAAVGLLLLSALFLVVTPARARAFALCTAIVLIVLFAQNSVPVTLRNAGMLLAVALIVAGELRSSSAARGSIVPLALIAGWWAIIAAVAVLSDSYSGQRLAIQAATMLILAWSVRRASREDVNAVVRVLVALGCLQTGLAILEVVGSLDPLWGFRGDIQRTNPMFDDALVRSQGTFGHPLILGFFQGLVLVLAWTNPARLASGARIAALAVIALGLVLSGSRSALLVAAAAIAVHILLRFHLYAWLRGVLLISAAGTVVYLIDPGVSDLVERTIDSGSWIHRMGSLAAVPRLLARTGWEYWWGSGYGSETELFQRGYIADSYGLRVVDNFVVYLLGTTGVVGLCLTLAVLLATFVLGARWVRALVVYVFGMFFSFDITVWLSTGFLMFLVVALPGSAAGRRGVPAMASDVVAPAETTANTPRRSMGAVHAVQTP